MASTLAVVLPNYNHAAYLPEALKAITDQTRPADEIIVIDDASTDDSMAVLSEWGKKFPTIKIVRNEKNSGVVATLNKGIALAKSDCLYMAAADDRIYPRFFETALAMLDAAPSAGLCSGLSDQMTESGEPLGFFESLIPARTPAFFPKDAALRLLARYGSWFMGDATVFKRQALLEAGCLDSELESYADGFVSEVIAVRRGVCFVPQPLAVWRRMPNGYSADVSRRWEKRIAMIKRGQTLMKTKFSDLFPPAYTGLWTRRQILAVLREQVSAPSFPLAMLPHLRELISDPSLIDKMFFKWIHDRKKCDEFALKCYGLLKKNAYQHFYFVKRRLLGVPSES